MGAGASSCSHHRGRHPSAAASSNTRAPDGGTTTRAVVRVEAGGGASSSASTVDNSTAGAVSPLSAEEPPLGPPFGWREAQVLTWAKRLGDDGSLGSEFVTELTSALKSFRVTTGPLLMTLAQDEVLARQQIPLLQENRCSQGGNLDL
eukprot:CAMPEP_0177775420 /NCGR_PEP_ID=MMETSP0491_2-20121128/14095_1 /TAXON_ID=63592 /ORGANISM="Tetraselmis chuii, Strain PLY429" /LENGTH=147 /DNA_ID=CAMNT_0019293993 /DNA_START=336 /DNA_END=779 /DNA_ORIENTATION=-